MAEKKTAKKTHEVVRQAHECERERKFTAEERAAMKERAQELKAEARPRRTARRPCSRRSPQMPASDRAMAERIHALVKANAPDLTPRT